MAGSFTMKHSQLIGIIAALGLIAVCFLPWSYVASKQLVISGMNTAGTSFGKPGMMNIILAAVSVLLFLLPKIWAKRTNLFIAALGLAWSIRNFLLVTSCLMGECPEKKAGIFLLLLCAALVLLMTLFPKIELKRQD